MKATLCAMVTMSLLLLTVAHARGIDHDEATLLTRTKRQLPPLEQGNQVIDSIFQIPISTLNAVGTLIKSARPLVRRTRERIQQYYSSGGGQQQQQQPAGAASQQQYSYSRPTPQQYGGRPTSQQFSYYGFNRRKPQQARDDPSPQGRHRGLDDY